MSDLHDCREAFARALAGEARQNERIVALANDSIGSSNLGGFGKEFPSRLFNVGIAEQDLVGIAAGLANGGKIPFACGAACFLTGRALEQVKVDLAYSKANVKLCGMSPGLAYGALGATHHAIEDLAWLRVLANLTIVAPADALETEQAVRAAARLDGPVYLRISRVPLPLVHDERYRFVIGRAALVHEGDNATIIACGTMVTRAVDAAALLAADGLSVAVVNMSTIRPIDRQAIAEAAARGPIVTVEEHSIYGGLGGAVAEVVATTQPVRMRMLGVPGAFAPTGPTAWLLEHFGLTPSGIRDATLELLRQ